MMMLVIKVAQYKFIKFCKYFGINFMLKLIKLFKDVFVNQYFNNIEKN